MTSCVRVLASHCDTEVAFSNSGLTLLCAGDQVLTLFVAGTVLGVAGGLPPGPLFGPPLVNLLGVYSLPLLAASYLFGRVIDARSRHDDARRFRLASGGAFAAVHLASIPITWALFALIA